MNTRAKGRKNEIKTKKLLEAEGYIVELAKPSRKYQASNDLFGAWDVIGIRWDCIRLIQVKSNKKVYGKAKKPYISFVCPPCCTKEIWVWYDRQKEPYIEIL